MDLIIEHRVDFDGIIGGLIVEKYLDENGKKYKTLGWNYGDDIPDVSGYDRIILTDICLPSEFMLENKDRIIWIDHHETQIDAASKEGFSDLPGIRLNGRAACELTWEYFFKTDVPKFIQLIGAYDIWDHKSFSWDNEVLPLQYGLKTSYGMANSYIKPVFDELINGLYANVIYEGKIILGYLGKTWKSWCKNYAFEVKVADKFLGICMLTPQFGSSIYQDPEFSDKYEVFVCANKGSDGKYHASLYTDRDLGDFSLGAYVKSICQTGVGGGHKKAAGVVLTEEQFIDLITKYSI
jgi:oligoribonuclease NrnB/cAMP/cGMP phosphodiesterase (DHH superfamily)